MHFPLRGPLTLRPEFVSKTWRSILLLVALLGPMAAFFTWYGVTLVRETVERDRVWRTGELAVEGDVDGRTRTQRFVFNSLEGKVHYEATDGARHEAELDVTSMFESFDTEQPLVIKYDPRRPELVALSWSQSLSYGHWAWGVVVWVMALFMGGAAVWLPVKGQRSLRLARACCREPEAVRISVLSAGPQVVNGRPTGSHEVKFELPGEKKPRTAILHRPALLLDEGGRSVGVALRTRWTGSDCVVLGDGLYPYAATAEDVERVLAAMSEAPSLRTG